MRIKRMLRVLFSSRSERNDAVSQRIAEASKANAAVANRLTETIRDVLVKNDELTGRKPHAH